MEQRDVARVRQAFEEMLAGDPEQWVETLAEDVRWDVSAHPLPDVPDRGRGRDEAFAVWNTYVSGWNDYRAEVREVTPVEEELVVTVRETVRMRETNVPLDRDLIYVWTMRGDRISLLRVFKSVDDAMGAIRPSR